MFVFITEYYSLLPSFALTKCNLISKESSLFVSDKEMMNLNQEISLGYLTLFPSIYGFVNALINVRCVMGRSCVDKINIIYLVNNCAKHFSSKRRQVHREIFAPFMQR